MAMANRLSCYAKAMQSDLDYFTVASEGQKRNGQEFQQILTSHDCWHWRAKNQFDDLPIIKDIVSSWMRWKLYRHILRSRDIDVVFTAGYRWPQMLLFAIIAHVSGKKYCIELNEFPHSIKASRMDTEGLRRIKRWLTLRLAFPNIDGFIAISENLNELALKYASSRANVIKIPILTDYFLEDNRKMNSEEPFIFHAGTLTREKDGIIQVFEGFGKAVQGLNVKLNFELSNYDTLPDVKTQIESIIDEYNIREQVIFHNHLSEIELAEKFQACSMVIINKPDNFRNRYNFSTKLGECMSYGLPIITTSTGESDNYLIDGSNCIVIRDSQSSDEIMKYIARLNSNSQLAESLGRNARETAIRNFGYENYATPLSEFFKEL